MAAVVLAAGGSTRMGRPKPLLPVGDTNYLGRILRTLAAVPVARFVVVGSRAEQVAEAARRLDPACSVVVNDDWRRGMLSSLQLAIGELQRIGNFTALLLCPVDTPGFRATTAGALLEAAGHGAPIVVPRHGGRHGHPVLFADSVWGELLRAPADQGARAVVESHRHDLLDVDVDDPWVLCDADTPEAHARLRAGLERQPSP